MIYFFYQQLHHFEPVFMEAFLRKHLLKKLIVVLVILNGTWLGAQSNDLGSITFPTSGSAPAQEQFLRGVLLLHSFEYEDAREAFLQAQKLDPKFAMAYWGEAMTYNHPIWVEVDSDKGKNALNKLGKTQKERQASAPTQREKDYLLAVEILYGPGDKKARDDAYAQQMRVLYEKYPDDLEAAAFYSLALLGSCQNKRDYAVYMKAAAISEEVYIKNSKHPGALHYLIHSYDDPVHAPLGLRPARVYAQVAPAAAHALHMPAHIFLALGMWDDVILSNQASWAAADARMKRKNLGVDSRGFHALHWLEYGYLQEDQKKEAWETLTIMEQDAKKSGSTRTRWHYTVMRAAYVVETEDWNGEAASLQIDTSGLEISGQATDQFIRGFSAYKSGKLSITQEMLNQLKSKYNTATKEMKDQEGHPCHASSKYEQVDLQAVDVMEKELESLLLLSKGKKDEAVKLLQKAAAIEASMDFEFGPPLPVKPAQELLGEVLLEVGKPGEAKIAFTAALTRYPGRTLSSKGLEQANQPKSSK
jgi:tetratricopeptide (TPR) repeat protein